MTRITFLPVRDCSLHHSARCRGLSDAGSRHGMYMSAEGKAELSNDWMYANIFVYGHDIELDHTAYIFKLLILQASQTRIILNPYPFHLTYSDIVEIIIGTLPSRFVTPALFDFRY